MPFITTDNINSTKKRHTMEAAPSPTSVTNIKIEVPPSNKRQKQLFFGTSTTESQSQSQTILSYISDDALTCHIFTFVGPQGTAQCARTCKAWHWTSLSHPSLWRNFCQNGFGVVPSSITPKTEYGHVYSYLATQHQTQPAQHLEATVVFADDGGNFPGYPADHALLPSKSQVWCTSTGVDQNVDLVVELEQVSLITGFVAANGGRGYSAPLQEGLVFAGMEPPDLDTTRIYNAGAPDSLGSAWVHHLFQPDSTTDTNNNNNNEDDGDDDERMEVEQAETQNDTHRNNNNANPGVPRPESKSAPPYSTTATATTPIPVAAFSFPHLTQAYYAASEQTLPKPILAKYIHFKLLQSHSPPGLEHISDNIDLMHFHPKGVPLETLESVMTVSEGRPIPEYKRQHSVRRSRLLAAELGQAGPWWDVDLF